MTLNLKDVTAVIMARRPAPGRTKTRLTASGAIDATGAADLAEAMLQCTVRRLTARTRVVLAVTPDGRARELAESMDLGRIRAIDQGPGDLGQRMDRVWRAVGTDRPIAFFGGDSPDIPDTALNAIGPALSGSELAAGPTADGGYWTLAAASYAPPVLRGIDWGGPGVYDQTLQRAREAGMSLFSLPPWHDVDHPEDVAALRCRLAEFLDANPAPEPGDQPLRRLAERIESVLHASPSHAPRADADD